MCQSIGVGTRGARCAIAPPRFLLTMDLDTVLSAELLS